MMTKGQIGVVDGSDGFEEMSGSVERFVLKHSDELLSILDWLDTAW